MELGKPNLVVFADTLLALAQADKDILIVTSDSRGSGKLETFCNMLPDQVVEVGIAEQNLVGISAGLASAGKNVFNKEGFCHISQEWYLWQGVPSWQNRIDDASVVELSPSACRISD